MRSSTDVMLENDSSPKAMYTFNSVITLRLHVAFLALCEIYSREINRVNVKHILGDPSCAVEGTEVIVTFCRCRCSSADEILSSSSIFVSLKQLCPECTLIQSDAAFEVHLKSSTCLPTY